MRLFFEQARISKQAEAIRRVREEELPRGPGLRDGLHRQHVRSHPGDQEPGSAIKSLKNKRTVMTLALLG